MLTSIHKRIVELKNIIRIKEKELLYSPPGIIYVCGTSSSPQYYYKENSSDRTLKYIKKKDQQQAEQLCQKDYNQKVLVAAQTELEYLEQLLKKYPKASYEDIYSQLSIHRQKLIQPVWLPNDEYVKRWQEQEYGGKDFRDDIPEYYTDRGERVRSKSEIIIANALNKHGIPYRYEYPLKISKCLTIYPDFNVLNVRLRKEIYWEHLGMMDDAEYSEKALRKIHTYEENGFYPGENLILTYESQKQPLNTRIIENLITHYLK